MVDMVQLENNMMKLSEIVSGQTVVCLKNVLENEYEIVSTDARMMFNNTWYHCIAYRPKYDSAYDIFVRTIEDFMSNFRIKKN